MARIEKGMLLLLLLALFGFAAAKIHSFDIFWQLQSGKYILQSQALIFSDIFSLAADVPRYEHCWLHDIVFYGLHLAGGYAAVSLFKGVLVLATAVLLIATARIRRSSWLSTLCVAPLAVLLTHEAWLARPQLWTFFFFALFIWLLERHRRVGDRRVFFLVPAMVLWANLHAGAILAAPILAAYLVGETAGFFLRRPRSSPKALKLLWAAALAVAAACFLTPYPSELWQTLVYSPNLGAGKGAAGQATGSIMAAGNNDWQPTSFANDAAFFYAAGFALGVVALGWRRLLLTDLLLLGGLAFMGSKLSRHAPFLFFAVAALLPVYLDAAVRPLASRIRERARATLRAAIIAVLCLAFSFTAWPLYRTYGFFDPGLRAWKYPVEAADFVRDNGLPGNLFNSYTYGGYLMWTLYPDYRVFWDGRQTSGTMFYKGMQVSYGIIGWQQVLDEYQVNTVVTKACTVFPSERYPLLDRLWSSPQWALVFADESSLVFVRRRAVAPGWLAGHELPKSRLLDTLLSEATHLVQENPDRYNAYWEIAQVRLLRREFPEARQALAAYLAKAPEPRPEAISYFNDLVAGGNDR